MIDLQKYNHFVVAFSGGKDSFACVLHLLEQGVPPGLIELHHHLIDGREGSDLMDWAATEGYCRSAAMTLGLPIYYSWKEGGFEGEMTRKNRPTAPTAFECPEQGHVHYVGGEGPPGTRLKFPQVSPDLSVRWCSAYLKIHAMDTLLRNSARFLAPSRTLVLTGERAQESTARSRYKEFEPDRAHVWGPRVKRHVDHWRPVHSWPEEAVWDIIARWKIRPHPCYQIGFSRCSCQFCIFGGAHEFATNAAISPDRLMKIAQYEQAFGVTIKRKGTISDLVAKGVPFPGVQYPDLVREAVTTFPLVNLRVSKWVLPMGAFKKGAGPS